MAGRFEDTDEIRITGKKEIAGIINCITYIVTKGFKK
jgi:hypothetical protein